MDYDAQLAKELGVYRSPGLGTSWPQLSQQLLAIYADRVAKLPFVPLTWFEGVRNAMANGDVVRLLPPRMLSGAVKYSELPDWITSDNRRVDAWAEVATAVNDAVVKYARGQAEAGRAQLEAAYANAAFWDKLYLLDKAIVDLPANVGGAVAGGVGRLLLANWWVVLAIGVAALVWFNKGSIARAAGKRIGKAVPA